MNTKRSVRVALLVVLALATTGCLPRIYDDAGTNREGVPAVGTPVVGAQTVLAVGDDQAVFGETYFLRSERVRSIDLATGELEAVAGTGHWGVLGDGGPAAEAHVFGPAGMDRDAAGNLYVAESKSSRVRKVAPNGATSTFAGHALTQSEFMAELGSFDYGGFGGDGLAATAALLDTPTDVAVDAGGNGYIADSGNFRVRRVSGVDGTIDTVVGGGALPPANGLTGEQITLKPLGLALDPAGDLVITTGNNQILRWDPDADVVTMVGGTGQNGFSGDGGQATSAKFSFGEHPYGGEGQGYVTAGVDVKADGTIVVADTGNLRVRAISPGGTVATIAGGGVDPPPGVATLRALTAPSDVSVAPDGSILIADLTTVLTLEPDTFLDVVAGDSGFEWPYGDGEQAETSPLILPFGLDFAADGTTWFTENSRWLRSISPGGVLDTVADLTGHDLGALALSGNGTAWIAPGSSGSPVIEVSLTTGTIVRTLSISGSDLAVDPVTKSLYVADGTRVWKVNPATGAATTYAGGGAGGLGDGGLATDATLGSIAGLAVHPTTRDLFLIADRRVRQVNLTTNVITTVAGTGVDVHSGDGGPALAAGLFRPLDLAFASTGTLYILEAPTGLLFVGGDNGGRIRRMTIGGNIDNYVGTGGPSGSSPAGTRSDYSRLGNAYQIDVNPVTDELHVVDTGSNKIRRIAVPPPPPPG